VAFCFLVGHCGRRVVIGGHRPREKKPVSQGYGRTGFTTATLC
jgi:hypothetical protein